MAISNLLVTADGPRTVELHNFDDVVVVRLALPAVKAGVWMLIGRVVIANSDADEQSASARLTTETAHGNLVLDAVDDLGPNPNMVVSLQGFLRRGHPVLVEPIVDLRCSTYFGVAAYGRLFALLVDEVKAE
jgi:hypothetical protein